MQIGSWRKFDYNLLIKVNINKKKKMQCISKWSSEHRQKCVITIMAIANAWQREPLIKTESLTMIKWATSQCFTLTTTRGNSITQPQRNDDTIECQKMASFGFHAILELITIFPSRIQFLFGMSFRLHIFISLGFSFHFEIVNTLCFSWKFN